MKTYKETVSFELQFWLQVLGDHGRFIRDSLAPKETKHIEKAKAFIHLFDSLLSESRKAHSEDALHGLAIKAEEGGEELREFKLLLLEKLLLKDVSISLPPSFLNHMVNELDEFLRVLTYLTDKQIPPLVHPLHHDLLWLLDAAGHAGAIDANLDRVEKDLKQKSEMFTKQFEDFYLKAVEMAGYLRTNLTSFPALARFHHEIDLEFTIFKAFLREIEELELTGQTLSVLTPLMADHMAREECYYLMKLAESTDVVNTPNCDPTKPRTGN
ncbi:DUF2935 domain-containing protein [Bacillus sp. AK128]